MRGLAIFDLSSPRSRVSACLLESSPRHIPAQWKSVSGTQNRVALAGARGFTPRLTGGGETESAHQIFHTYTSQQRKLRSSVGGQEHMEHIEHVFSYIIPGLAPRGVRYLPFPQSFSQKYVFHVFCVFSQRKSANAVCSVMCSNVFGDLRQGVISPLFCATCASFRRCCRKNSRSHAA